MNQNTEQHAAPYGDEISLAELFAKLWRKRGLIFFLPLGALLVALAVVFYRGTNAVLPASYYVELSGIEKLAYPNGTRFSPTDLKVPEVLDALVTRYQLSSRGDLSGALSVGFGSPLAAAIHIKYDGLFAQKGLDATELEAINASYSADLAAIQSRSLRIDFDYQSLGMTPEQAARLLQDLPAEWSRVYKENYNVLAGNRLSGLSISRSTINLNNTAQILSARDILSRLKLGAATLANDGRLVSIRSEQGYTASDLMGEAERFERLYFKPIFTGLFNSDDQISRSFVREVQLEIDELSRNITALSQDIEDIQGFLTRSTGVGIADDIGQSSAGFELNDNALDRVLELSQQASLSEYLTEVLNQRRGLESQRSALFTDIARSQSAAFEVDREFLAFAERELKVLVDAYLDLLSKAEDHYQKASGQFYVPVGDPILEKPGLPANWQLIIALALVLGFMVAVIAALLWPESQRSKPLSADN